MGSFVENVNKLAANMPVDGWASLDEKVDKVAGKGLSTEDYTSLEKQKLYGIAEGATSNAGDAFLTDRGNHTGTQSIDTITESASLKILTAAERVKLDAVSVHPETHPVSIIYGLTNPSKFVKTDAAGNTGFSDVTWSDVQGKPSSFNPNVHQHSLSDLSDSALKADKTYVDTQLSAKADTSTLTIELAKKADLNIVATYAELQTAVATLQPLSQKGQANGYVPLDSGGKIPNSYLNNLSTIEVFTANSQANMLLLSNVSVGDQCIRTDLASNNLFILTQTPATELTNWKQINTSASVLSVNGQTGVVNVSKTDVGLGNVDNTADVNKEVLSATKLATARTISLTSDVTGSASFNGSGNISITATVADNSHNHTLANISDFPTAVSATELSYLDGTTSNIQTQLNAKQDKLVSATNIKTINGNSIVGSGDLVIAGGDMLKTTYDTTNNGIVDKTENLVGGNNTTLLGSIPYQSNTDTSTLLAPNTTTTRKFLRQTGSGTNGSAPVWDTILASDVPTLNQSTTGNAATATTATNVSGGTVNATTGTFSGELATATQIVIGTGGDNRRGAIYSDGNWGMLFRAKVDTPNMGHFIWVKGDGSELFRHNGTALTTNITGNSGTSTALVGDETNWASYRSRSVANMLSWKNYGNGHVIFDASASTAPNGTAVNNTNSVATWQPSYPTLMGWNGIQTYGVRVDSARVADDYSHNGFTTAIDTLKDVPQNAKTAAYTLTLTDRGKSIDVSTGGITITVPLNSAVDFPIGATVSITNLASTAITVSSSATLRQAGTTNTGNRTLAAYGMATLRKVETDTWFISGAGLS